MIGNRTRYSLAQFMEIFDGAFVVVLFNKHGARLSVREGQILSDILNVIRDLDDRILLQILGEVFATEGDLGARVNPRYRFDQRMQDLRQCLLLDGYVIDDQQKKLLEADPSVTDTPPIDDDLITTLQTCGLRHKQEIIQNKAVQVVPPFRTISALAGASAPQRPR